MTDSRTDRAKVEKGLRCHSLNPEGLIRCQGCPYRDVAIGGGKCLQTLHQDVVKLFDELSGDDDRK